MTRVFSGVKPTGHLTLGNYLGALRQWVAVDQHRGEALFCVVDLHALTVEHDPARVRRLTRQAASLLLAVGLDPELCTVFVQSHVDEHARLSLLTYPALMAADILAYQADEVPVGDDQTQHVQLARDLAVRFNQRYGHTFVVPRATRPAVAARVMNLQDPVSKMGKSDDTGPGIVYLLDEPEVVRKKVMRAVTDSAEGGVVYDREGRPGVANLLEILAACAGGG
jgi:tryptophanyl-tRNA synthetase